MKEEKVVVKLIKHIYGITGVLDEYKRAEINRIGNNAFMATWLVSFSAMIICLVLAMYINPATIFWVYLSINMASIFITMCYISYQVDCLGLGDYDKEEINYVKEKKILLRRMVISGIFFTTYTFVMSPGDLSMKRLASSIVSGIIFVSIISIASLFQLKRARRSKIKRD
ncbi:MULTISPECIES: DUF3278 domain-containing protein [Vagococcus]|uniref:DUF3278 domain-containing protein n=1 Tax=Vagococcus fluvialis bH819 TaxID=1255619 RepID=A0A1X6WP94_9ENTE|nr:MULTISPECIES: DUF3278 domain-containing protein [Vagococcus]SLM86077.1 hypothetical protein FM121_08315 [Vagococcus fluvialis bH819]HCM90327.1 DUF3278 domain-containing protein [Vagococcus sp.]